MLQSTGDMNSLEWQLYESWFQIFGKEYPVNGIIYISTSSATSKDRIINRNRSGEENIDMEYLNALDIQHKKWIENTSIPVLTLSTEIGVSLEENIEKIRLFIEKL